MPTIGGGKKPKDPYEGLGAKDSQPVYREGEKDQGKTAHRKNGDDLGKYDTPQEAADAEQKDQGKRS